MFAFSKLLSFPGGRLLSIQFKTDRGSSDPAELSLLERGVQPLPEHLLGQLQGAPVGRHQGREGLQHRKAKDLGGVLNPPRSNCRHRPESLRTGLPAALVPCQQGLHRGVPFQVRAAELFRPQAFPTGELLNKIISLSKRLLNRSEEAVATDDKRIPTRARPVWC